MAGDGGGEQHKASQCTSRDQWLWAYKSYYTDDNGNNKERLDNKQQLTGHGHTLTLSQDKETQENDDDGDNNKNKKVLVCSI